MFLLRKETKTGHLSLILVMLCVCRSRLWETIAVFSTSGWVCGENEQNPHSTALKKREQVFLIGALRKPPFSVHTAEKPISINKPILAQTKGSSDRGRVGLTWLFVLETSEGASLHHTLKPFARNLFFIRHTVLTIIYLITSAVLVQQQ